MRNLLHPQFVLASTQIEKAEMGAHAAPNGEIARHRRIETAGDQRHYRLLRPQRKAADTGEALVDDEQAVIANLQPHFYIGVAQIDTARAAVLIQQTSDMALHVERIERVLPTAAAAHAERLVAQSRLPQGCGFGVGILDINEGKLLHFEKMGDAWRGGE